MVINRIQILKTAYENISFILNTLSFDKSIEYYSEILDIEIKKLWNNIYNVPLHYRGNLSDAIVFQLKKSLFTQIEIDTIVALRYDIEDLEVVKKNEASYVEI